MPAAHFTALKRAFIRHEFGIANEPLLPIEDIDKLAKYALRAMSLETPVIARRVAKQMNLECVFGEITDAQATTA